MTSDVLIVGAGHNGLVCAFYLAARGLKVKIVERRAVVGGAAVTEEFHPGFRNSVAAYTVSLLNPKVIADMDLVRPRTDCRRARALRISCRSPMAAICSPGPAGRRPRSPNSPPRMPQPIRDIQMRSTPSPMCCAISF